MLDDAPALLGVAAAPRLGEVLELADRDGLGPQALDELGAARGVGARQRHQRAHRGVRRQSPVADGVLNGGWQHAHQRQASRDPARGAAEPARELGQCEAVRVDELAQEPRLLERRRRPSALQVVAEDERVGLGEIEHDGLDEVVPQALERGDPAVAVDQRVAVLGARRHEHGAHLPLLEDRGHELSNAARVGDAQRRVRALEVRDLDLHGAHATARRAGAPSRLA